MEKRGPKTLQPTFKLGSNTRKTNKTLIKVYVFSISIPKIAVPKPKMKFSMEACAMRHIWKERQASLLRWIPHVTKEQQVAQCGHPQYVCMTKERERGFISMTYTLCISNSSQRLDMTIHIICNCQMNVTNCILIILPRMSMELKVFITWLQVK